MMPNWGIGWPTSFASGIAGRYGAAASCESHVFLAAGLPGNGGEGYPSEGTYIVDIYNAQTRAWLDPEEFPSKVNRSGLAAAAAGNLVLFGGGYFLSGGAKWSADVDIYDVASQSWKTSTTFGSSVARSDLASSSKNLVVFAGGSSSSGYVATVDIYDVDSESWNTSTTFGSGVPREILAATAAGGYIIIAGGRNNDGFLRIVDIYNVDTMAWYSKVPMVDGSNITLPSGGRRDTAAVSAGGTLAIFGGGETELEMMTSSCDVWNFDTMDWETSIQFPSGANRTRLGGAAADDGIVLFGGGQDDINAFDVVDILTYTFTKKSAACHASPLMLMLAGVLVMMLTSSI